MMQKALKVLIPEATRNYCTNPSIGLDVTGWTALGASARARVLTRSRFGRASLEVTNPGAAVNEGCRYTVNLGLSSTPITGSVYVRGAGPVYLVIRADDNAQQWQSEPIELNDRYWQRLVVTGHIGTTVETDFRLEVRTFVNRPCTFYVDGAQIEAKGHVTTYCDGDLELLLPPHEGNAFFEWVGQRHATQSFRTAAYRSGGYFEDLTQGLDVNLFPTEVQGLGMPPLSLASSIFVKQEKATVQGVKAMPRAVGMTFHARRWPNTGECDPKSLRDLHRARRALEDVVKPDLVQREQAFVLRYEDGECPSDLDAFYEAGLEYEGDIRDPYYNSFGVRLFCPDPYWRVDSQDAAQLITSTTIVGAHPYLIARLAGEWTGFGSVNFPIKVARVAPNGDVYIGGAFTTIGGTTYNRIARWDGVQWNTLGAVPGFDDGEVRAIDFDADGNVYIGGTFTTIGAVSYGRVAKYTPSTNTFSRLVVGNAGVTGPVNAVAVAADGSVYIGGSFVTSTGGTTRNRIVKYTPGTDTFSNVGAQPGLDAEVFCLEVDLDGSTIFIGGSFTQENGKFDAELPRICKWNGTAYSPLQRNNAAAAIGCNATVRALKIDLNGNLYLAGDFTTAGFWTVAKVAYWSRSSFFPLGKDGDGLTGGSSVYDIDIDARGLIYFAGDHTAATNDALSAYLSTWNGTRFSHLDLVLASAVYTVASKFDKLFVGYNGASVSAIADVQSIVNYGKATAYPIVDIYGPITIRWLENQSTGAIVRFNLVVGDGERVLIDFRRGQLRAISEWRGNVVAGIMPDSDFGDFYLLPGTNVLSFLATAGDGSEEVSIRWQVSDWSFDDIR